MRFDAMRGAKRVANFYLFWHLSAMACCLEVVERSSAFFIEWAAEVLQANLSRTSLSHSLGKKISCRCQIIQIPCSLSGWLFSDSPPSSIPEQHRSHSSQAQQYFTYTG